MKNNKNKIKGFTLVELLISVGLISLATVGIYASANVASDWRKSSQEVKSLNSTIIDVNNSISTTGVYTGVTLSSLKNMSINVNSALSLSDINSPSPRVLHFVYNNVNPRICNDFSSKMLSSSKNIGVIINGEAYNENNISNIVGACNVNDNSNDVTVVLNQEQNNFTVTDVVASVNLPLPPPPDIIIPSFPPPPPPIVIPPFVPPVTPPVVVPPPPPVVVPPPPPYVPPPPPVGVPPPPPVSVPPPPPPPPPAVPNIPVNNSGSTVVESDDFDYYVTRVCVDGAKLGGGTISGCANLSSPVIYTFVKTGVNLNNISIGYLTEKFPSYSNNYSLETSGRSAISCNEHGSTFSYMFNGIFSDYRDAGNSLSLKSLKAAAAAANGTLYGAALCGHISGF